VVSFFFKFILPDYLKKIERFKFMLTVYDSHGKSYVLTNRVGSGGEGAVYSVPDNSEAVAKIYHEPVNDEKAEKLNWMAANKNEQLMKIAAWITDVLRAEPEGRIVGFLMPRVRAKEIHELYSLKSRRVHFPRATWPFLIHAAANVARAFYVLHKNEHVMGDVNHGNCVVLADGTVKLIDCDSYSVRIEGRRYPCEVGVATHLAPELQGKNLAGVERLPAHDNFGLAVIVFQLLFLGRHPFAGKLAGGEDKSLEECIRELRFAYARDAQLRKIARPPGTLALEAVGPRVAQLFERAFLTAENRPAPREWVEALEDLSAGLKQCGLHPGHHYFQELAVCPFCEIEAQTGLMLFPVIGGGNQTDGEETFNIFTVENLLASFGSPQNLPAVPPKPAFLPPPSPVVRTEQMFHRLRLVMFAVTQFFVVIFLLFAFGNFAAFYVGIVLTAVFIAVHFQSHKITRGGLIFELESAQTDLKRLENDLHRGGAAQFENNLARVREKISEYQRIQRLGGQKMKHLREEYFRYRRDLYLSSFKIAAGKISGVGQNRLEKLKNAGVESAADVELNRLRALEGVGATTAAKLLEWRASVEKNFEFNAEEIPEAELKRFAADFVERRRAVEREIENLLGALRSGSLAARQNGHQLRAKLESAVARIWQAESDLKEIGTGAAAIVGLLAVTFSTLFIGNMAQAPVEPQSKYRRDGIIQSLAPPSPAYKSYGSAPLSAHSDYSPDYNISNDITDEEIAKLSVAQRRSGANRAFERANEMLSYETNYNKIEQKLRLAVRLDDSNKLILNKLASVLYEQEKYSDSLSFLYESLVIDPDDAETKILVGKNYLKMKEFEKAREILSEVGPKSYEGSFKLGLAHKGLKDYSSAIDAFRQALHISPGNALLLYEIAVCLDKIGDKRGARQHYEKLLEINEVMARKLKREIGIRADFSLAPYNSEQIKDKR
jgi:DNA-binding helix-hairpin-helix protein with protein kinase domain